MNKCFYKIADFDVAILIKDATDNAYVLPSQYEPFCISESECGEDFLFEMAVDDAFHLSENRNFIHHFDNGDSTQDVYQLEDGTYQFGIGSASLELACEMQATPDFSRITVALRGNETQRDFAFNNAMMIAFAFSSALRRTLLMHSSTLLYADKGYMFLGESGTGKSTHSKLWLSHFDGCELLNDDNPAIRFVNGNAIVYGTPWSGKTPCYKQKKAPVGALVQLEQRKANVIKRMIPVASFASVYSSCSKMLWDKTIHMAISQTVSALVGQTPVYHLGCLPDEAAARLCKETIVAR